MNAREQKSPRRSQRRAGAAGDGAVVNAGEDADVARPAAADVEAQVADHQIKVAMAAYFIAEKRGFEPGHELEDWVAAEAEIAMTETPSVLQPIHPSPARSAS
jgi:DUF2934 family protein